MAMRDANEKGMQGDRHHPAICLPLLVQNVKLIHDGLLEVRSVVSLAYEKKNVVQFDGVRNGEQLAFLHLDHIRFVIVAPIAQVANTFLSQKIRGDESLGQGWS